MAFRSSSSSRTFAYLVAVCAVLFPLPMAFAGMVSAPDDSAYSDRIRTVVSFSEPVGTESVDLLPEGSEPEDEVLPGNELVSKARFNLGWQLYLIPVLTVVFAVAWTMRRIGRARSDDRTKGFPGGV